MEDALISPLEIQSFRAELDLQPPEKVEDAVSPRLVNIGKPKLKRPTLTYAFPASKAGAGGFHPPEYNLAEIGQMEDTDAIVFQANIKRLALSMKAGWSFIGRNTQTIDYIKARLAQIEVAQGQTVRALLAEIMSNLIRYHNCYLIKKRDIDASGGQVRRINKRNVKPVAGYFVVSPEAMEIKIDKGYNVSEYKHILSDGRNKRFRPEDVIHIHVYRKTHFLTGTPAWIPVIEDVRALRRIEEHIENLVYQHLYPLFLYQIGTEKFPDLKRFSDGRSEIEVVRSEIEEMPTDGMLVVPFRHQISSIGSESRALRAEQYLLHFKQRVIMGSGMSEIDFGLGDTANRATADTMSKLALDNVKFFQECLSDAFNFHIIRELLLESTFDFDLFSEENMVDLKFNEIDLEAQIKKQNHFALLFQMNIMTRTEARKEMGLQVLPEGETEDMFLELVTKEEITAKADADKEVATVKVNAAAKNKQQPTNQNGTNSGPSKRKSFTVRDGIAADIYSELKSDIKHLARDRRDLLSLSAIDQLFVVAGTRIKERFFLSLERSMMAGLRTMPFTDGSLQRMNAARTRMQLDLEADINRLMRQASSRTTAELLIGVTDLNDLGIDVLEFRIRFIERTLMKKANILGKLAAFRGNGIQRVVVRSDPDGEDFITKDGLVIDLTTSISNDFPPFHPNCRCDIEAEL